MQRSEEVSGQFSPSTMVQEIKFTSSDLCRKVLSSWPARLLGGIKYKIQPFGCSKKISYIFSKTSICIIEKTLFIKSSFIKSLASMYTLGTFCLFLSL